MLFRSAVVQGFAWFPKWLEIADDTGVADLDEEHAVAFTAQSTLYAYAGL